MYGKTRHLGQRACHQHTDSILTKFQCRPQPRHDGVDVLQRAAELHTIHVMTAVDTERIAVQQRLYLRVMGGGCASNNRACQVPSRNFTRQIGATEHAPWITGQFIAQYFAHQVESRALDSFGQTDKQCLLCNKPSNLVYHFPEGLARDSNKYDIHALDGVLQQSGCQEIFVQAKPWQILRVFVGTVD